MSVAELRCMEALEVSLEMCVYHKLLVLIRIGALNRKHKIMGTRDKDRDLERLIPETGLTDNIIASPLSPLQSDTPPGTSSPFSHNAGKEAFDKVIRSWASKKFITGCVILCPIAITFYVTWWFIQFGDWIFSPIYTLLGINIFGLGFVTTITSIFFVGVFMSSWLGTSLLSLGELIIKKMPLMSYIYTASKQISSAISPGLNLHISRIE
nr:protein like COV 3-like [Tanacetum cinerariifolium]